VAKDAKRGLAGVLKIAANRSQRREQWRKEAVALWEKWRLDPLFLLGVGLYWGEGTKSRVDPRLALTNADVGLLSAWISWCRRFLPAVPLTFSLIIHDTCDPERARQFWKDELGIDTNVVTVAVSRASKRQRNCLPNGTVKVRVGRGSREWITKMLVWLELAQSLPFSEQGH
jgi:hypothetical protein